MTGTQNALQEPILCQKRVKAMSKLRIEALGPRSPHQTYLDELLQSARWLGWEAPAARPIAESAAEAARTPTFAPPMQGKPA